MLIDTDVLIWYLRGNKKAQSIIDHMGDYAISSVTYMEILQGLKDKKELRLWKKYLHQNHVRHILFDHEITSKAIYWLEEFGLSHKLKMADALVAATAESYGLDLISGNIRDYNFLPGLKVKKFTPK